MYGGKKNSVMSDEIRRKGNESFHKEDYFDALSKYNEALRYAEINSKELGLCYSNRSAVFLKVKQFDACLENIQLARKNNFPDESTQKLIKREIQCRILMASFTGLMEKSWNDFFKMSYSSNPNIPFLADCIELKKHERGMFLATKRALKAGDIIGITEPIFRIPFDTTSYRCNYCLADKFMNFIPCSGCIEVMFCNERCMKNAFNEFHQFECGICDNPVVPNYCMTSLRIIMKCLSFFDGSSTKLNTFLEQHQKKLVSPFDFSMKEPKSMLSQKNLLQIHFRKHQQICSLNNNLNLIPAKSFSDVEPFLQRHSELKKIVTHDLYKNVVALSRTEYLNNFKSIDRKILSSCNEFNQHVKLTTNYFGAAIDVCFNLFLHSCAPTVFLHAYNGKIIWIVLQPMKPDDWLTVAFQNSFFSEQSYEQRKKKIPFLLCCCKCPACTGNWKPVKMIDMMPWNRTSEEGIAAYDDYCNIINNRTMSPSGKCDELVWKYVRYFYLNLFSIGRATWNQIADVE